MVIMESTVLVIFISVRQKVKRLFHLKILMQVVVLLFKILHLSVLLSIISAEKLLKKEQRLTRYLTRQAFFYRPIVLQVPQKVQLSIMTRITKKTALTFGGAKALLLVGIM